MDRPTPFARIRHSTSELRKRLVLNEGPSDQIEQPGSNDTAAAPNFRYVTQVQLVLIKLRIAQWSSLGTNRDLLLSYIRVLQYSKSLRVSGHQAIFDAIVDHLHKMASAART